MGVDEQLNSSEPSTLVIPEPPLTPKQEEQKNIYSLVHHTNLHFTGERALPSDDMQMRSDQLLLDIYRVFLRSPHAPAVLSVAKKLYQGLWGRTRAPSARKSAKSTPVPVPASPAPGPTPLVIVESQE